MTMCALSRWISTGSSRARRSSLIHLPLPYSLRAVKMP
jgi:hypothetical protein